MFFCARDGASASYRRFVVPAGRHRLRARLKDHMQLPNFNYNAEAEGQTTDTVVARLLDAVPLHESRKAPHGSLERVLKA